MTRNLGSWMHAAALALLCLVLGLCFHDGRDVWHWDIPLAFLLGGSLVGIVGSALLLPLYRLRTGLWGAILRALPGMAAAVLLPVGLHLSQPWLVAVACAAASLPLALFLDSLTSDGVPGLGLRVGSAMGAAAFVWQVPIMFSLVGTPLCLEISLAMICALVGLCAAGAVPSSPPSVAAETASQPPSADTRLAWETLAYMTGISLTFFLLNAVLDWQFYRMHARDFPIPAEVSLYIWAVFPLTGSWLQRHQADSRLLLFCLAVVIMSPLLVVPLEGTVLYWLVYACGLLVKAIALVFLVCVFCQFRAGFGQGLPHGLVLCLPWLCLLAAFGMAHLLVTALVSIVPYYFLLLVLVASFGYLSIHVQYALTLAGGVSTTIPSRTDTHDSMVGRVLDVSAHTAIAVFSKKYGISKREQEVLGYILEGCSSGDMLDLLSISPNTLKSHMRQLLRKTQSPNRTGLVTLYFHEYETLMGTPPAPQHQRSTS